MVADQEATRRFYEDVIGLPLVATWCESTTTAGSYCHTFYELDDGSCLAFFQFADPAIQAANATPSTSLFDHVALHATGDVQTAIEARAEAAGVGHLTIDHGYCRSLYVPDPDGLLIEITVDEPAAVAAAPERRTAAHDELARWLAGDHTRQQRLPNPLSPGATMRLANLDGRATIVVDGSGIDVAEASGGRFGPGLPAIYDDWTAFLAAAGGLAGGTATPLDESRLGPPSPSPTQVFAIGLNYKGHAAETGATIPTVPATFTKFQTCLTGPSGSIRLPSDNVDWEVELVLIIGARAEHVAEADGWSHVAGVTIGQDLSERVVQFQAGSQFSLGKSYAGFGPMGPWLVTPDELPEPDDLGLGCSIAGEVLQDSRTSDMAFNVAQLVAELSAVVTLLPGDVVFTGTPSGVGAARQPARFLRAGEALDTWIEGVGTMRHTFTAD